MNQALPGWQRIVNTIKKRALVCDHKKLLISSSEVRSLNSVQLDFEYEGYIKASETRVEDRIETYKLVKSTLIQLLGLNLMPVLDDQTGRLRLPDDGEIMPLSMIIANDAMLKEMTEKLQQYSEEQKVLEEGGSDEGVSIGAMYEGTTPEDFEQLVGDIDFESLNPDWDSDEAKATREAAITLVDFEDMDSGLMVEPECEAVLSSRSRVVVELEDE